MGRDFERFASTVRAFTEGNYELLETTVRRAKSKQRLNPLRLYEQVLPLLVKFRAPLTTQAHGDPSAWNQQVTAIGNRSPGYAAPYLYWLCLHAPEDAAEFYQNLKRPELEVWPEDRAAAPNSESDAPQIERATEKHAGGSSGAPVLRWPLQQSTPGERTIFSTMQYNSQQYEFLGRAAETAILHQFVGDVSCTSARSQFAWVLVTGDGGDGKTRLAFEFTKGLEASGWNAGLMSHVELQSRFEPEQWLPKERTFIVIDDVAQVAGPVHRLLAALDSQSSGFRHPVRVLLMERKADQAWVQELLPDSTEGVSIREHAFPYDERGPYTGWALPPIEPDAIVEAMQMRFKSAGRALPPKDLLLAAARRLDGRVSTRGGKRIPCPRPLMAMAAAEALLLTSSETDQDLKMAAERLDAEGVFERLIKRDRQAHWTPALNNGHAHALSLHENACALATMCGGLTWSEWEQIPANARHWLPADDSPVPLDERLLARMVGDTSRGIPAIEPDILGEFFVLDRLKTISSSVAGPKAARALIDAAFALGKLRASNFAYRCCRDFRSKFVEQNLLVPTSDAGPEAVSAFYTLSLWIMEDAYRSDNDEFVDLVIEKAALLQPEYKKRLLADLVHVFTVKEAIPTGPARETWDASSTDAVLEKYDQGVDWETLRAPTLVHPMALMLAREASALGSKGDWDRHRAVFSRLDRLRSAHAKDIHIGLLEARALVNLSAHRTYLARTIASRPFLKDLRARLHVLFDSFGTDRNVALTLTKLAHNILCIHAREPHPSAIARVSSMIDFVVDLRKPFPEDSAIADLLAHMLVVAAAGKIDVQAFVPDQVLADRVRSLFSTLTSAFPTSRSVLERSKQALQILDRHRHAADLNPLKYNISVTHSGDARWGDWATKPKT